MLSFTLQAKADCGRPARNRDNDDQRPRPARSDRDYDRAPRDLPPRASPIKQGPYSVANIHSPTDEMDLQTQTGIQYPQCCRFVADY